MNKEKIFEIINSIPSWSIEQNKLIDREELKQEISKLYTEEQTAVAQNDRYQRDSGCEGKPICSASQLLEELRILKEEFEDADEEYRIIIKRKAKALKEQYDKLPKGCGKWQDKNRRVHFHCGDIVLGIKMLCDDCKKQNEEVKKIMEEKLK